MTRNFVLVMKRWWMVALVFTLALSLTSCSRKSLIPQSGYGLGYCDGTLGSFDVYVYPTASSGVYQVSVIPVSLDAPGDIVSITVANQSLQYRELQTQVVLNNDMEILAGTLTDTELEAYDIIAITPYQPGVTFLEATPEKDAVCRLPLPGDEGQ
jgi:hypothetical protein